MQCSVWRNYRFSLSFLIYCFDKKCLDKTKYPTELSLGCSMFFSLHFQNTLGCYLCNEKVRMNNSHMVKAGIFDFKIIKRTANLFICVTEVTFKLNISQIH